jgi:hypothetical protein
LNFNFIHKKDSNLNFNHEFNPILHAQLVGLILPFYLEVSISDTQEHPLGVYLEKESLYFNITQTKCHTFITYLIIPYHSVGDFPVDVMMNQFDLSNWNYNDDSDLYESIGLIKDHYNIIQID